MSDTRLNGVRNYLYFSALGASATGALTVDRYHKITGKLATGSQWPEVSGKAAVVKDVVYASSALTMLTDDTFSLMTLTKAGFTTNVSQSASKEKFEETTQVDEARSYQEGTKPEITGSIEGYFTTGTDVKTLLNRFFVVVDVKATTIAAEYLAPTSGVLHLFLGRRETAVVGQLEIMQYMPVIVDSVDVGKPMEGMQPFTMSYTIVGSERPSVFYRTIPA